MLRCACLQLEKEISEEIATWAEMKVYINDLPFDDYVKQQWEGYQLHKEQEKNRRVCTGIF